MPFSANHAPSLLPAMNQILQAHRSAIGQARVFSRMLLLARSMLMAVARHTITQALLVLGLTEESWSAFYRLLTDDRIQMEQIQQLFLIHILAHVPRKMPFVVAIDGVQLPRSSATMLGVGWAKASGTALFQPGLTHAQRFGILQCVPTSEHG